MRPWARGNQDVALGIGRGFAPRTAWEVWGRRLAMTALPYLPGSAWMMPRAMRGIHDAAVLDTRAA